MGVGHGYAPSSWYTQGKFSFKRIGHRMVEGLGCGRDLEEICEEAFPIEGDSGDYSLAEMMTMNPDDPYLDVISDTFEKSVRHDGRWRGIDVVSIKRRSNESSSLYFLEAKGRSVQRQNGTTKGQGLGIKVKMPQPERIRENLTNIRANGNLPFSYGNNGSAIKVTSVFGYFAIVYSEENMDSGKKSHDLYLLSLDQVANEENARRPDNSYPYYYVGKNLIRELKSAGNMVRRGSTLIREDQPVRIYAPPRASIPGIKVPGQIEFPIQSGFDEVPF